MDGDNLCRVMNSLSIIASEKIGRNYPQARGKFHFLSVIFVMKKLSKIINSVFRKKYKRDDNISKGKELKIGYLAFKNICISNFL